MKELTERQEFVFNKIKEYIQLNGYSPTIRELCQLCGVTSTATIFMHLLKLKDKGYIDYEERKFRTIVILKEV